jgi:lysophospholipase L1-like esterase
MIGREWTSVERIFTARTSEDSARIQVNLGGDTADVFVADVEMEQVGPTPVGAGPEHRVVYSWNSRGCRARDYPIPEESGAFRILALGDSYTAGVGVYAEDLFTAAMEQALNEGGGGRGFEVINCGVSGFGTREQALYYQQRLSDYEPDLVLVVMTANDDRSFGEDVRMGYVHRPTRWESIFDLVGALQTFRHRRPQPDFSDAMGELAALHELLREEGTEMGVVLFTNTTNRAWDLLAEHAGSAAAALDVPLLDLREALSSVPTADLMVHPSDGHPNEIAHRIAGETIVGWLEQQDLLREN